MLIQTGQHQQREDLQGEAAEQRYLYARAGRDPSTEKIGDDAKELVKEKEERDRYGVIAQPVKMQDNQHPQCTIGDREAPVGGGDEGVTADAGHCLPSRTNVAVEMPRPCGPVPQAGLRSPIRCRTRRGSLPAFHQSPSSTTHPQSPTEDRSNNPPKPEVALRNPESRQAHPPPPFSAGWLTSATSVFLFDFEDAIGQGKRSAAARG